jgi:prolycopene isomerase
MSAVFGAAAALNAVPVSVRASEKPSIGEFHAVVIGSGLGGLTFAAYMAIHGFKVLVLEQHDVPGGYATTFTRDGGRFTFDVSLHQTALVKSVQTVFRELGVTDRVTFHRIPELFHYISPEDNIRCPAGEPDAFEQELARRFPDEADAIRGFMETMIGLNKEGESFVSGGKPTLGKKLTFPIRFPLMWAARNKTLASYLDDHVSNARVRSLLSVFWPYYGLPPDKLSGFYYMNATGGYFRYGGSYPEGGSQAISNALVDTIEENGGEVRVGVEVARILMENGRAVGIVTSKGESVKAASVVVNGSPLHFLSSPESGNGGRKAFREAVTSYRPSMSSFLVWLGLNRDITREVTSPHLFFTPEIDAGKAYENGLRGDADKVGFGACVYNSFFPGCSPEGTSVINLIFLCGYEPWKRFEDEYRAGKKEAYRAHKEQITETLIERAEKHLFPGLRDMIAVRESATPLTNERFTRNTAGAIYGFEQSMSNTFMNRISNRTAVPGLYLAGAWGEPGGGLAAVMLSGKKTFGMLMNDWKR